MGLRNMNKSLNKLYLKLIWECVHDRISSIKLKLRNLRLFIEPSYHFLINNQRLFFKSDLFYSLSHGFHTYIAILYKFK